MPVVVEAGGEDGQLAVAERIEARHELVVELRHGLRRLGHLDLDRVVGPGGVAEQRGGLLPQTESLGQERAVLLLGP